VNRYTAFFLAALVAIVVACNTDRPTSQSGIERIPVGTENITAAAPTFKMRDTTGKWYALTRVGDFFTIRSSDSAWVIRAQGVTHYFNRHDLAQDNIDSSGAVVYWNNPVLFFEDTVYGVGKGTASVGLGTHPSRPDSLILTAVSPNQDSAQFKNYRGDTGVNDYVTFGWQGLHIVLDNKDNDRYYACSSTPTCSFALPAPTNATLANNGPLYAKITWSNNGDSADSTEVWFGKSGQESKVTVQGPGITTYTTNFAQGTGLYDAWVFHRWNGNISTNAYTNSLTH
jgi:hypothetical protein